MACRLRVMLSAYACEPFKGSEPECGWQWALQMARFHEVTVLTRSSHRPGIERGLATLPAETPVPMFVFHDCNDWVLRFVRRLGANAWLSSWLGYLRWQKSAWGRVAALQREHGFDLFHHVSWTEFRSRPAIWGHGVPSIWGPVNGSESTPWRMLQWRYPRASFHECCRNISGTFVGAALGNKARQSTVSLVSTRETAAAFARLDLPTVLFQESGVHWRDFHPQPPLPGPLRLLYDGRILFHKGIHLALAGLAASATDARLTLIGTGKFQPAVQRLAASLQLGERVRFEDPVSYPEMLRRYPAFDVFLFPTLHDSSPFALLEAMAGGLPAICLDCAGPAIVLQDDCGIKVPLADIKSVVAGLAAAIRRYDSDRALVQLHGRNAWRSVMEDFLWDRKGERMDAIYREASRTFPGRRHASETTPSCATSSSGAPAHPRPESHIPS